MTVRIFKLFRYRNSLCFNKFIEGTVALQRGKIPVKPECIIILGAGLNPHRLMQSPYRTVPGRVNFQIANAKCLLTMIYV